MVPVIHKKFELCEKGAPGFLKGKGIVHIVYFF